MAEDSREEHNATTGDKTSTAVLRYLQSPTYRKWFQAGGDIDDFIFYEEQTGQSER